MGVYSKLAFDAPKIGVLCPKKRGLLAKNGVVWLKNEGGSLKIAEFTKN